MKKDGVHKYGKLLLNVLIYLIVILFVIFVVPKIIRFFMPFVIGGIIAWIANPLVKFLENRLKIKRKAGTVVVIVAVIAIVCAGGYLLLSVLVRQGIGFLQAMPEMWEATQRDLTQFLQQIKRIMPKIPLEWKEGGISQVERFGEYIAAFVTERADTTATGAVTSVAHNIVSTVIDVIMGALAAYFFIADKDYLEKGVRRWIPSGILNKCKLVYDSFKQAVGGYFKAQFKIELWIYLLLTIGLTALQVNYAFIVAFGIALLDFLPFFGTGIIMLPWAIIKFFTGEYIMCFGVLVMWGGSQLIRQLIQPKIMGDTIGVAPIPTLFLLFVGYHAGGVFGMLIAVPLGIIFINLNQAGLFDTLKISIRLLLANINQYRKITQEDMSVLDDKNKVEGDGDKL